MNSYTLCLPSFRPLITSQASIESAIAYCAATGGVLVVSDNSGDPQKQAFFNTVPDHVVYCHTPGFSGLDNLLNCLDQVKTEFILPMGDDDFVRVAPGAQPFDFGSLAPDYAGVKPQTEIQSADHSIVATSLFSILDASPQSRMISYCAKAPGNNSTYYSFYRRSLFEGLFRLLATHHPTKGGYIDWSLVLALMSFGKMAQDPSTIFTYHAGKWLTRAGIDEGRLELFRNAGLPDHAEKFEALLGFLDLVCFVSSRVSPLGDVDKRDARQAAAIIYLRQFLEQVDRDPSTYEPYRASIAALRQETLRRDTQPENIIPLVLSILDLVKPGLAEAYIPFLAETMS